MAQKTCTETYDLTRVAYLYEHLDLLDPVLAKCDQADREIQKNNIKGFLERILLADGDLNVTYMHAAGTDYGRMYSNGIQAIKREVRGFLLCKSAVIDVDLENAHPCILYYLCGRYGIQRVNHLKQYVENRQSVFEEHFADDLATNGKEFVKRLFLVATNMDKRMNHKAPFLQGYMDDMEKIREMLTKHPDFKHIVTDAKKKKKANYQNINGSIINRILCKYEHDIVAEMRDFVRTSYGAGFFADMFDGAMFTVSKNKEVDCAAVSAFIQESRAFGHFKFLQKDIVNGLSADVAEGYAYDEARIKSNFTDFESVVKYRFLEKYRVVKIENPCLYAIHDADGKIVFKPEKDLIQSYRHIKYHDPDKKEPQTAITRWLESSNLPDDIVKEKIVNNPLQCPAHHFNVWIPFKGSTMEFTEGGGYDEEAVGVFTTHVRSLCDFDEKMTDCLLDWISHLFKYPTETSFCPIIVGQQGTGKDLLVAWIGYLLGDEKLFETKAPEKEVWGDFNPRMRDAYLVFMNEIGKRNTIPIFE